MSTHLPPRGWTDSVRANLLPLIEAPSTERRIAALDWDETCIRGDISYALLDDMVARTGVDHWSRYRALYDDDHLLAYKALALWILRGRRPDEVRSWTVEVAQRGLASGKLAWVPEMADLVDTLHDAGWEVWVVTGSPTTVVASIAAEYGIPAHRVLGMDAPLDDEGRYGDHLLEPVTWREGKPRLLQQRAGRRPDLAFGDSEGDIKLLESARHAVWIDRGDPALRLVARERGWWRQEAWR